MNTLIKSYTYIQTMSDLQSNTQTLSDPGYFHNNNNGNYITNNNNMSSTTIPLKEWTKRALQSSNASSSNNNTYLSSALTIAKSLVNQICSTYEQQQQGTNNIFGGWDDQLQFHQQPQHPSSALPTPGSNWSDHIIVHLSSSNINNMYNEGYERQQEMHSQELSDILLNSLINDSQVSSQPQQLDDGTSQVVSHLNVTQAEILPSQDNNVNSSNSNNNINSSTSSKLDEMKHIYSLGIVFYQLFTGEEPPHELLNQIPTMCTTSPNIAPNNSLLDDDDNDVRQFQGKSSSYRMKEGFKSQASFVDRFCSCVV